MLALLRSLHLLALAVWLGSVVFFTVAGLLIFQAFEEVSRLPQQGEQQRPLWFPVPEAYSKDAPGEGFPEPLRLEQGSRAGGVVVSKLFPVYFALQTVCAGIASLTAVGLAWAVGGGVNRARVVVCVLGLAAVIAGWWLERQVHQLRGPRNDLTDAVLQAPTATAEQVQQAREARSEFGKWHGISLLVNFATFGLALAATLLAAHLPATRRADGQARTAMA
jgi:hypothetical protein